MHGRDAYGNECALPPKAISLQSVPEGALSDGVHLEPGRTSSSVVVTASVLAAGAALLSSCPVFLPMLFGLLNRSSICFWFQGLGP